MPDPAAVEVHLAGLVNVFDPRYPITSIRMQNKRLTINGSLFVHR